MKLSNVWFFGVTWIAIASAVAPGCGGKKSTTTPAGDLTPPGALVQDTETPGGLEISLSDGKDGMEKPARITPARATVLGDREAKALLSRLPALAGGVPDKQEFVLRPGSRPAPRTGTVIDASFPPPETGQAPVTLEPSGAGLEVLRRAPEGEVPLAPHVAITFSQPMVVVTSQDAAAKVVPVVLTPEPKGTWRWLGTRTLLFDPDPRLPQATEFTVQVPAGTRSATGAVLADTVSWTFATPAPRVETMWPERGPQPRDVAMFVAFDQAVDPDAVLATIQVRAGKQTLPVRALGKSEIAAKKEIAELIEDADKDGRSGRYVAFVAAKLLPADTSVTVDIGPGTPSREGPRKTTKAQSFSFRTYGPLRVKEARCSWGSNCPPMTPWYIRMENPLDLDAFDPAAIRVEPEVADLHVEANGNFINIRGQTRGSTTYTVTLPATLKDTFGQTLGRDEKLMFRVGKADPRFFGPSGLVVLDPAAKKPTLNVFSINHEKLKVELYAVTPDRWGEFVEYMRDPGDRNKPRRSPPGNKVVDTLLPVRKAPDELVETEIDLGPALTDGLGHVVALVEPSPWPHSWDPPQVLAWVQATGIGLDAFVDSGELIAWASRLDSGAPLSGVTVEIVPAGGQANGTAVTDDRGMATLALAGAPAGAAAEARQFLLAKRGKDTAFLPESTAYWRGGGGWHRSDPGESLRWYVFDDRAMYRPGEEVHLKGWVRRMDNREGGGIVPLQGAVDSVSYVVYGPRDNELAKGTASVNALGGFDTKFTLPDTPNLGWARVALKARGPGSVGGREFSHSFQIQEFRRPEYEVTVRAGQGPHMVGGSADVTVAASYYAGGGLVGAPVTWDVTAAPGSFIPPNRDDFVFGMWKPWWDVRGPDVETSHLRHQALTDAAGRHILHMDFGPATPPQAMSVTAQASVVDVNRQAWAASTSLLVHPADLYVGLKTQAYFVEQGAPIELEAIVVDHDGKARDKRPFEVRAVRLDWVLQKGKYVTRERDAQTCAPVSAETPVSCTFATKVGGEYRITARVVDDKGRPSQTQVTMWVSGGKRPPAREVEMEEVTLIPDKKDYQPGDVAEILVQSPFSPAEGVLTLRRSGIVETRRFALTGPTTTLKVPITAAHVPNIWVQVDIVGAAERVTDRGEPAKHLPKRPALASGSLDLAVPPLTRVLAVDVTPRDIHVAPGGRTQIDVAVRDAAQDPVAGAEVAVVVVDESVLALSNYQLADPVEVFYARRAPGARDYHLRESVALARPEAVVLTEDITRGAVRVEMSQEEAPAAPPPPPGEAMYDVGSASGKRRAMMAAMPTRGGGAARAPVMVRQNFNALAAFAPQVRTDARGRAVVEVVMPDNLTRYRVMAVAVADDTYFGKAESAITARLPLMVRPSPPRFLNFGDTFELPVVVQNQTGAAMEVQVAVRGENARLTAGLGRVLRVPANERVEVRFPAAAELAGTARFQLVAAAGTYSDAADVALPVWTPATTEAFATYGEVDRGAVRQPVAVPGSVVTGFGGLEITTSSTQLQALTDAFLYLVSYPFECAEQVSSRVLAVAALRDVLTAFHAEGLPPPAEIEAAVKRDMDRLHSMQNWDGGFGFWRRGTPSWPYGSIHVAHALARARAKGFFVPDDMLESAGDYLRDIERHIPDWYPDPVRHTLIAYALSVRKLLGDSDPVRARGLLREAGPDKLPLEAAGWLLGVMTGDSASRAELAELRRYLGNRVTETAGAAHFVSGYADGGHLLLHSDRRADAVILEALIADSPKSDLIPKLVRGLLSQRKRGRWQNTQDNAFVLLALDRYFQVYEAVEPSFYARAWLGDAYAGEHRFRGRTTEQHQIDIPMSYLAGLPAGGKSDVILQKDGKGRMYYRIGMRYAPSDLKLAAADRGFAVVRAYEPVDDPADVVRLPDGTWKLRAGARVRVHLSMVAQARRYHVALVDPLPAGLEPMNPALAVTGDIPQDPSRQGRRPYWWWQMPWYEHQNMRDDRVEAFASLVWEGVHEYSYVARATTPGRFVVPPARAEEMYTPETFGRSATDTVVIE